MIANGDVKTLEDADVLHAKTKCNGVMAARGILANPALFSGSTVTPQQCVQDWVDLVHAAGNNITFQCFHHHLTFMMDKLMRRRTRVEFNSFTRKEQVFDFLQSNFDIIPRTETIDCDRIVCEFDETNHKARVKQCRLEEKQRRYDSEATEGQYFRSQMEDDENECDCGLDFMDTSLFDT